MSAGAECLLWDRKACSVPGTPSFLICKVGEGIFSQAPWLLRKAGEEKGTAPYPLEKSPDRAP